MKKIIISLLILTTTLSALAQIPNTNLPFSGIRFDRLPYRAHHFSYRSWPTFNDKLWEDFQLTIPKHPRPNGWQYSRHMRSFISNNGSYSLKIVSLGTVDYNKNMLVTSAANNTYIDALEVGVALLTYEKLAHLKQYKIGTYMRVTVYQLKPTSTTPIMLYSKVTFPLRAQRIDIVYQIDSNGRFSQVSRTLYQPKNYSEDAFTNPDVNIWDGIEIPMY